MTDFDTAGLELLDEHVRHLLAVMDFESATVHSRLDGQAEAAELVIAIEAGNEGKLLIGPHGSHLVALQHVLRALLRDELPKELRVAVDVNDYLKMHRRKLQQLAESTAARVQKTGQTVALQPMNASDRRVLHTALAQRQMSAPKAWAKNLSGA